MNVYRCAPDPLPSLRAVANPWILLDSYATEEEVEAAVDGSREIATRERAAAAPVPSSFAFEPHPFDGDPTWGGPLS